MKLPRVARIFRELMRDRKNPAKRLEAMMKLGDLLVPGYRFSWPNPDWWKSEEFTRYLQLFQEETGLNMQRRWTMHQLLRLTHQVPGDTAECGVYRGAGSWLIMNSNERTQQVRHHHMFDSFEGISKPTSEDGEYWAQGDLTAGLALAEEKLAQFASKSFYPGWIPNRFGEVADKQFSFVHIDVDLHDPTRDSLAFFHSRLSPGGILLCDDYTMEFCPGATRACDEFMADKPEKFISLADGSGYFVKGTATDIERF